MNGRPDDECLSEACIYGVLDCRLQAAGAGDQYSGDCDLVSVVVGD